jgi:hypothetical protein
MTHPRSASRLPLKGASAAAWQSQIGAARKKYIMNAAGVFK